MVPFCFRDIGLDSEQISDEMLPVFVSELRLQYQKQNPDFCQFEVPEALQEVFTAFTQVTNNVVAKLVYDKCTNKLYNPNEVEINLSKMVNENAFKETREKGIKFFNFGHLEAQYLYDFRKPLHDLLEKMYELNMLPMRHALENMPFMGQEHGFQNAIMAILEHEDFFASFVLEGNLNALIPIGQLGFDLNIVMVKKEAIANLLKAAKAVS